MISIYQSVHNNPLATTSQYLSENIWKSFDMWTAVEETNTEVILAVMTTTYNNRVVKIMPEKKIQAHMQFEPMTSVIPVSVPSTFFIHALSFLSALWCERLCTESVKAMAFTLSMIPSHFWSWKKEQCIEVY